MQKQVHYQIMSQVIHTSTSHYPQNMKWIHLFQDIHVSTTTAKSAVYRELAENNYWKCAN